MAKPPYLLFALACLALVGFLPRRTTPARMSTSQQSTFTVGPGEPDAETLSGYWEANDPFTDSRSQIGILLKIIANRRLPPGAETAIAVGPQKIVSFDISVYRRTGSELKMGWFSAVPDGGASWDGHRLQIQFDGTHPTDFIQGRLSLDLAFDERGQSWTGDYTRKNETRAMILTRPGASSPDPPSSFAGVWQEQGRAQSSCFYIVYAAHGTPLSWRNSRVGPIIDPREMERSLQEADGDGMGAQVDGDTITLQEGIYWSVLAGRLPRKFIGKLSSDGSQIIGKWYSRAPDNDLNPPNLVGTMRNLATLTRIAGQSCWRAQ